MNIVLAVMPFWPMLTPPMGLACLKGFLQQNGFKVSAIDTNTDEDFRNIYDDYFERLRQCVPPEKQAGFLTTGFNVWQNHMMAHFNQTDGRLYRELVKQLVYNTYYITIRDQQADDLSHMIRRIYGWLEKYVSALLEKEQPDVLGLSVYSSTLAASLFTFKYAKTNYPAIKTVMGGGIFSDDLAQGSPNMNYFLEETHDYIDCIVAGEGEQLLLKYLRGQLPAGRKVFSLKDPEFERMDLADTAAPDFSDFQLRHYTSLGSYTSRSCPYQCDFCNEAAMWGKYRKRKVESIRDELLYLHQQHGRRMFFMCDSLVNPVTGPLSEALEKTNETLYWDGFLRADKPVCDIKNTIKWRRGGMYRARLGLESGSPAVLRAMGKKITPQQIRDALASLAYAGIKTTTYWVIGHPGETEEDFQQTLDLIEELKDDIYEADCNPFYFFPTGQVKSAEWSREFPIKPLYNPDFKKMLMLQTWIIDCEPQREEVYQRVLRFARHCKKLGIPNPYSLKEISEADERWKKLHKNAVPSLLEILENKSAALQGECKRIGKNGAAQKTAAAGHHLQARDYWLRQLAALPDKSHFMYDYQPAPGRLPQMKELDIPFETGGNHVVQPLLALSKGSDVRLFITLAAVLALLLRRYTGNHDILTGAPVYRQNVKGELLNSVLALRCHIHDHMTFKELLKQVSQTVLDADRYRHYPVETLLYKLDIPYGDGDEFPLFDVSVLLENIHEKDYLRHIRHNVRFRFNRDGQKVSGTLEYNSSLYNPAIMEQVARHLVYLLQGALKTERLDQSLAAIQLLSEAERKLLLEDLNGPVIDPPQENVVHRVLENQARKAPLRIAVCDGRRQLSYGCLNQRANRLARVLRTRGAVPGCITALLYQPSVEMAVAILAVLKAGTAYLPIDPELPVNRLLYMLKDSCASILLTHSQFLENASFRELRGAYEENDDENTDKPFRAEILLSDRMETLLSKEPGTDPPGVNRPADPIYILYTSGSSGAPKAVVTEHRNVAAYLQAYRRVAPMYARDIVLQQASYAFDTFVEEFYAPMETGGKIAIPHRGTITDVHLLRRFIARYAITVVDCSPLLLDALNDPEELHYLRSVTTFLSGGDRLKGRYISNLLDIAPVHNGYGPTEATVCVSFFTCTRENTPSDVPVGKPIANYKAYILDQQLEMLPIGVPGEICISGPGVSRGYLNNPELTNEKFGCREPVAGYQFSGTGDRLNAQHPPPQPTPDNRYYKTGDLGRWLPDGNIQYMGRIDQQVKIRGYRIELGEVEKALTTNPLIKEAVAAIKETGGGEPVLCAYYVPHTRHSAFKKALREHLAGILPGYMIPAYFIEIDAVPMTSRGKINRKALPQPQVGKEDDFQAPATTVEKRLAAIWGEILGTGADIISVHSNFFEIGGHSLKATMLAARIDKTFHVRMPLSKVFKYSSIREMAGYIAGEKKKIHQEIHTVEKREYYPQSSAQKRLFFLDHLENVGTGYNMPLALKVTGSLDRNRLEHAFRQLIRRQDAFRTSFAYVMEQPVQLVHEDVPFNIEFVDLCGEPDVNIDDIAAAFIRPFDLSRAPLLRVELVQLAEREYLLLLDMHHIIGDGASDSILAQEFIHLYGGGSLPPLELQYKDFSAWQNRLISSNKIKHQESYWLDLFSPERGGIPKLNLPGDFTGGADAGFRGDRFRFNLDTEDTHRLKQLCSASGATLYMTLLAAFNVFLYKYTSQNDIIVGGAVAGRRHADLDRIVGLFVNTLPMRNHPAGNKSFLSFLEEVKQQSIQAFENQDVQLERLVEKIQGDRDPARNPLFDVCFALQNFQSSKDQINKIGGVTFSHYTYDDKTAIFDLGVDALEEEGGIVFEMEYRTALFKSSTIRRMAGHLREILRAVAKNSTQTVADIDMLTPGERRQILVDFNDTAQPYEQDLTVLHLFTRQAARTPDVIAITAAGQEKGEPVQLSYRELDKRADFLAHMLVEKGVAPVEGRTVISGIKMKRSLELFVAILGVLKTGAAFMPIDPDNPPERVEYIMADSGAVLCLEAEHLEDTQNRYNSYETYGTPHMPSPSDVCYVLYTSGTTGRPKGVVVEQRNLSAYVKAFLGQCDIQSGDVMLQQAAFTFDTFMEEVFPVLIRGGRLATPRRDEIPDIDLLSRFIDTRQVNIIDCSPLLLNELNRTGKWYDSVHTYISGGDALKRKYVEAFLDRGIVLNGYGPTEVTVCVSFYKCTGNDTEEIPIGKPIANYNAFILDPDGNLLPVGVPGELCAAGGGIARGYLNNPELTAQRFVNYKLQNTNPKSQFPNTSNIGKRGGEGRAASGSEARIYKTGDLARWREDGNIEYLGRIDRQVKIRGYRIELEEISNRMLRHEDVKEVFVTTGIDNSGDRYLCAYAIATDPSLAPRLPEGLREYLAKDLPSYMIPAFIFTLPQFPLNVHGKVDDKQLPQPQNSPVAGHFQAPENEMEQRLLEIWSLVLEREASAISTTANFFHLGGHSLKAALLATKVRKEFNVAFPLRAIFESPTIKEFALSIQGAQKEAYKEIEAVEAKEYYPQSSAQKRLYFLSQFEDIGTSYNMPSAFTVKGEIDRARLDEAFRGLIKRHESLRTSFFMIAEHQLQRIHREVDFKVEFIAADKADPAEQSNDTGLQTLIDGFIRPFDLSRPPLLRVALIRLAKDEHLLLLDMHHIVGDGSSDAILAGDFFKLYGGEDLPAPTLQYKDYACRQNRVSGSGKLENQRRYWLELFDPARHGEIPLLDLATDFPRPEVLDFSGDTYSFSLSPQDAQSLRDLAAGRGATLYMAVLSLFNVLLYKYTGQHDIITGGIIAGRNHADVQDIIGMFVNTLALRNQPRGDIPFDGFLDSVKTNCLEAFENQDVQFEELVDLMGLTRDSSRNPLFDVSCAMQNFKHSDVDRRDSGWVAGLNITPYELENNTSVFDLSLDAFESGDEISMVLEYCTRLFKKETIVRMSNHLVNLLRGAAAQPSLPLSRLDMVPEEEKTQLLEEFSGPGLDYPHQKTPLALFEEQAARIPNSTAVVFEDEALTYSQLNESAARLAYTLYGNHAVRNGHLVGLYMEKSLHLITAVLGILKAGGAYVTIAPDMPPGRIRTVANDASLGVMVSQRSFLPVLEPLRESCDSLHSVICMDDPEHTGQNLELPVESPATVPTNSDLMMVIYTSGSTGIPRGVMVQHGNATAYIHAFLRVCPIDSSDVVLQHSSYAFDTFTEEVYSTLLKGATLAIAREDERLDLELLSAFIVKHHVDIVDIPPGLLEQLNRFPRALAGVRTFLVGGDVLKKQHMDRLLKTADVLNGYGTTETTVCVSFYSCREDMPSNIPVGKPLANYGLFVLDKDENLVPPGVPGQLVVAGPGVSRGYLNAPQLTAEKFTPTPSTLPPSPFTVYRTGDRVRWLPDGNLEFMGRFDRQVKIRGFRVEPDDIRHHILKHDAVEDAVVISRQDQGGDLYLCAYIVAVKAEGRPLPLPSSNELREFLALSLPSYMVPSFFLELDVLPLSPGGKINKHALPVPQSTPLDMAGETFMAPQTPEQIKLAEVWADVLNIERESIGLDDDFFALGGHSLKATVLKTRIREVFNVTVPLGQVFKTPTLRQLAAFLEQAFGEHETRRYEAQEDENLVLLRKGNNIDKHFYFIHGGSGEVEVYLELISRLDPSFNYWGLRATRLRGHAPYNTSIEEIAASYIAKVKSIQPGGPYYISAWCAGGSVVFEMIRQLEAAGDEIAFASMVNSHHPFDNAPGDKPLFSLQSDRQLLLDELGDPNLNRHVQDANSLSELWPNVIGYYKNGGVLDAFKKRLPQIYIEAMPDYSGLDIEGLVYYLNLIRTLDNARLYYQPGGVIKSPVTFFTTGNYDGDIEEWRKYFNGGLAIHEIPGDHFSILAPPDVDAFAQSFNSALKNTPALS